MHAFCIFVFCTRSAQLSMFHMERRYRNTLISTITILPSDMILESKIKTITTSHLLTLECRHTDTHQGTRRSLFSSPPRRSRLRLHVAMVSVIVVCHCLLLCGVLVCPVETLASYIQKTTSDCDLAVVLFVVGWLLNVPATCECISETDLLRQFYVLPH